VIDTHAAAWPHGSAPGHARLSLHASGAEQVAMERLSAGARLADTDCPGGEEIFVVSGTLTDDLGAYPAGTWLRNPPGYRRGLGSDTGSVYWIKRGHLSPPE
jgi:anti-sigma factor ChrR (cupin superfamily)